MIRVPHILGVVGVLGCGEPPLADAGGGAQSESETESETETETESETETETGDEPGDETSGPEGDDVCVAYCQVEAQCDPDPYFCMYQFDCYGSGKHRVDCTAEDGCICSIDGVAVGSCDSLYPALCEPFDPLDPSSANSTIVDRLNDCCGWALEFL